MPATVTALIGGGDKKILIDLTSVTYVDSATIGCLMDLYRQADGGRRQAEAGRRAEARRDDADDDRRAQLPRDASRRSRRGEELRGLAMRTIRTTTGADITLDGDLLAIMETLYQEVTARKSSERSFEDMMREIQHLIDQMTDEELRSYLAESLFLNTVKYENDKLEAYFRN